MKTKGYIWIPRTIANSLICAVVVFYTLINAAVIVLTALDGIEGREELHLFIAHSIGLAGGVWLCFFIPKERKKADAEWEKWEKELEAMPEED